MLNVVLLNALMLNVVAPFRMSLKVILKLKSLAGNDKIFATNFLRSFLEGGGLIVIVMVPFQLCLLLLTMENV
jgi:hypothetical protein